MSTWWGYVQRRLDERGWSVAELSKYAVINRSIIGRWRTEDAKPEIRTARALAKTFGVSLGEVLIASGLVDAEEIGVTDVYASVRLENASDEEVLAELNRRLESYRSAAGVAPVGGGETAPEASLDATWSSRVHKDEPDRSRR